MKRVYLIFLVALISSCSIFHKSHNPYKTRKVYKTLYTRPYEKDSVYVVFQSDIADMYFLKSNLLDELCRQENSELEFYKRFKNAKENICLKRKKHSGGAYLWEEMNWVFVIDHEIERRMLNSEASVYNKRDSCWADSYVEMTFYGILGNITKHYFLSKKDTVDFCDIPIAIGE